ncbi:hypothetical protein JXD38_09140 [candidate division WOR-3 bacterium]|nr:hypothetical protein [candidate division WOR-3 bacterium]
MTQSNPTADAEARLRTAINQDGLLDLFAGIALLLTTALAFAGWRVMGNPAVFAAIVPIFIPLYFEPTRKRLTYPRLGCPDYKPTREVRFATIVLTVFAVLGLVVFLLTALAGIRVLRPLFEHAPVWAALGGAGLLVLLSWWYRSRRFLFYIGVSALAVAAGYLLGSDMLVRLAILTGAVGLVMTFAGAILLHRFLRSPASA